MAQWIAREFPKLKVVKGSTRFESHCYQVQGDSLLSSNLLFLNNVIPAFPIHTMCSSMCYECTGFVSSAFEYSGGHWPLTFRSLKFAGVLKVRHLRKGHSLFYLDSVIQLGADCTHDAP